MPALKNPKHELFALEFSRLKNATQAAIAAGYAKGSAHVTGSRLLRDAKVAERTEELITALTAEQTAALDITKEKWLRNLAAIAFGNASDFVRFTEEGEPAIDFTLAHKDQLASIAKLEVHDYLDGRGEDARDVRSVKFAMHPKLPALVKIGEHFNWLKSDGKEVGDAVAEFGSKLAEVLGNPSPMPIPTRQPGYTQPDE